MQQDSIERIRSATFTIARKGYEKREVERFLSKLADWLESGGGDQARSEVVKRELERVGEKTAGILASAEDTAEKLRGEAEQEATTTLDRARGQAAAARKEVDGYSAKTRKEADEYSAKTRKEADDYSTRARKEADAYSTKTRADADGYSSKTRSDADQAAQKTRELAEADARKALAKALAKAQRIVDEGVQRRTDLETVISDLVSRRDAVLADVNALSGRLNSAVAEHTPPAGADPFATPAEPDPVERGDVPRERRPEPASRQVEA